MSTEIYTLSLHDALPISEEDKIKQTEDNAGELITQDDVLKAQGTHTDQPMQLEDSNRSEEHTSELQSRFDIVYRLLLEKKNKILTHKQHKTWFKDTFMLE